MKYLVCNLKIHLTIELRGRLKGKTEPVDNETNFLFKILLPWFCISWIH